ncbi:MAG TPA: sialidase family protein [Steroidobacteraceae bacterium]|nr:sialidase family protein [Steroidobacteraceae bacterium]
MRRALQLIAAVPLALLGACGGGGGGGGGGGTVPTPPAYSSVTLVQVSKPSTFAPGCDGVASTGTLYTDTAAEPSVVVNPANAMNVIAGWQQNRWSDGGSQGLNLAASFDGGHTWTAASAAFSRCTGGGAGNAGDYARASDVWLTASPDGTVYALSLSFTGALQSPGSASGMLVAQSVDGGLDWGAPVALIADTDAFFDDKGSITADPADSNYVYAVWDRLSGSSAGPSYLALTADGGATWEAARSIYDPGPANQTLGNQIAVLPSSTVLDLFTELDESGAGTTTALARVVQSGDHGSTWSPAPVTIADLEPVGTEDPRTGQGVRDGSDIVSVSVAPGGVIYVAWQDSRFAGGAHDGIALAHSADGGATWSAPIEVNGDPAVQAFTPTVHVDASGTIAVSYYDLRNDVFAPFGELLADAWIVTSSDGSNFTEEHLSGPFDMDLAPDSGGLFVGDYEALASVTGALPFYAQTDPTAATVRSDAFMAFPPAAAAAAARAGVTTPVGPLRAQLAPPAFTLPAAVRARIGARIEQRRIERRREP